MQHAFVHGFCQTVDPFASMPHCVLGIVQVSVEASGSIAPFHHHLHTREHDAGRVERDSTARLPLQTIRQEPVLHGARGGRIHGREDEFVAVPSHSCRPERHPEARARPGPGGLNAALALATGASNSVEENSENDALDSFNERPPLDFNAVGDAVGVTSECDPQRP